MLRSGKVDFSAYKKAVKSATMRMFYGSLDQHGKSDGVITMQEWLKIMGQLGDKVRENPDPHHHAGRAHPVRVPPPHSDVQMAVSFEYRHQG